MSRFERDEGVSCVDIWGKRVFKQKEYAWNLLRTARSLECSENRGLNSEKFKPCSILEMTVGFGLLLHTAREVFYYILHEKYFEHRNG